MKQSLLPDAVETYVCETLARETPLQRRLRAETARLPEGGMQIGADPGALLALLARAIGARRAIEIGTFTGGLVALDNMLWSGKVVDPAASDESARALRALNAKIAADSRVDACLLTIGDGVMLGRKR